MSYLVDSDWLIDAQIGEPAAVSLLARLRDEGLAVSIISCGEDSAENKRVVREEFCLKAAAPDEVGSDYCS